MEPFEDVTEPRPAESDHRPAGPPKVMKTHRGARTPACRVHTLVNAVIDSASLCSQECEHGTHECVRHERLQRSDTTSAASSRVRIALPAGRGSVFRTFLHALHSYVAHPSTIVDESYTSCSTGPGCRLRQRRFDGCLLLIKARKAIDFAGALTRLFLEFYLRPFSTTTAASSIKISDCPFSRWFRITTRSESSKEENGI